jgi:DNA polymerase III subunit beta
MKLACSQAELNASLQLVGRAVAARPSHPVLANVLLTADAAAGRLSLTGFDLSLGIQASLPAVVEAGGEITLPSRLLSEIVSRVSAGSSITLECPEGQEQVELTSPSGGYQVRGMTAEDFPRLPLGQAATPIRLEASALVKALRATLFASSSEEAKQLLTGVHLSFEHGGLECAATDGHRLSVLRLAGAVDTGGAAGDSITVPAKSLRELERLLSSRQSQEPVSLFSDRGQVVFAWADQLLTSRSLDGAYPDYSRLIPGSFSRTLGLDRRAFIAALERVVVVADQQSSVVRLSCGSAAAELRISADTQDVGSGLESLPVEAQGEAIEIAFRARYLLDGLKAMSTDRVELRCNDPATPALLLPLGDPSFTYVVVPVRMRA